MFAMSIAKNRTLWLTFAVAVFGLGCEKHEETPAPSVPVTALATETPAATTTLAIKSDVSIEEAATRLGSEQGYLYLDVRTVKEFSAGHVPGSFNVPWLKSNNAGQFVPNVAYLSVVQKHIPKDALVLVGCRSGGRSAKAHSAMRQAGYTRTFNVLGGFNAWRRLSDRAATGAAGAPAYPVENGDGGEKGYAALSAADKP